MGGVQWRVVSAKASDTLRTDEDGDQRRAEGHFVVVLVEAENLGTVAKTLVQPSLFDQQGQEFPPVAEELYVEPEQIRSSQALGPLEALFFTIVFDVPTNASGLMLQVSDLQRPSTAGYVSLGEVQQ